MQISACVSEGEGGEKGWLIDNIYDSISRNMEQISGGYEERLDSGNWTNWTKKTAMR